MKAIRIYALLALLLMASRLFAYDFDAICSTGQTLYYNINDDGVSVTVTYPCYGGQNNYYSGYEMPQGDLTIPDSHMLFMVVILWVRPPCPILWLK